MKYEIEIVSKTYRAYIVEAESATKAQEIAFDEMDADWEISKAWKQNAEIESCNPVGGTSHMSNDEFGEYLRKNCSKNK